MKNVLDIPSMSEPVIGAAVVDSEFLSHFNQRKRDASDRHQSNVSAISILFSASSPTAISGFVIPVIVDAVNGVRGGRPELHVFEKTFIPIPSLTNTYSPTAIIYECFVSGIGASAMHSAPRFIGRGAALAVGQVARSECVFQKAPTRANFTRTQMAIECVNDFSALAAAPRFLKCNSVPDVRFGLGDYRES